MTLPFTWNHGAIGGWRGQAVAYEKDQRMANTAKPKPTPVNRASMSHRDRLLRQGMRSFYALGFHGTTVDAILEAAEVPKGSFYHHFDSKESFAQAVLEQYMFFQHELIGKWAERQDLTTPEKIEGYFDEIASIFVRSGYERACLAGKFSTELAAASDKFRTQLNAGFAGWRTRLVAMLAQGQENGDVRIDRTAEDLATTVLALLQGGFVLALSDHDRQSLESVRLTLATVVSPPG
ncbi:TetR/AcrR family transcriptional regulator [Streptomyces sp. ID05-04B]|uniref:TetR/AcrR family transcriptional regulator n=1 Tax=Streptomyces sp. ID05-04B TaxID=3028661 RepID=UPI0029C1D4C4|nr:TetR/AcrR family transcriptional regulator [Streptomyces sp. ID05-04B]MDX5565249.1 TetR/AcrR family transcriptional regulator [Streptomyces sp. ID05-04B]